MDPQTRRIYEARSADWIETRKPVAITSGRLDRFVERLTGPDPIADLGCGPGWYASYLKERGHRVVGLDFSAAMLREAAALAPRPALVCGDLLSLPFRRRSIGAALALNSYSHLPLGELPAALASLHAVLIPGSPVELTLADVESLPEPFNETDADETEWRSDRQFPDRLFSAVRRERALELLAGAGFEKLEIEADRFWLRLRAHAYPTLPDYVAPGLRCLFIGLNPSPYAAETGIPFGRPGNRFWPALSAAGLIANHRDPFRALGEGLGHIDLVKRPTAKASDLTRDEYSDGLQRADSLVRRYRPKLVCFIGLAGWRKIVDRHAAAGWIPAGFAGGPAYLMPSTSGLNASTQLDGFVTHLRTAFSMN